MNPSFVSLGPPNKIVMLEKTFGEISWQQFLPGHREQVLEGLVRGRQVSGGHQLVSAGVGGRRWVSADVEGQPRPRRLSHANAAFSFNVSDCLPFYF